VTCDTGVTVVWHK